MRVGTFVLFLVLEKYYFSLSPLKISFNIKSGSKLGRLYIITLLIYLICRVHHAKCGAG